MWYFNKFFCLLTFSNFLQCVHMTTITKGYFLNGWCLKKIFFILYWGIWCFWTVVLGKALESPLDCKEIHLVSPKGNQPWIFIGRTNDESDAPILWPPDVKSQLIRKDPDAGKDWRQEKKGTTEDEMVGWHHRLNGHEFEQALGDGEGQGNPWWRTAPWCCSPWGRKEVDMTEQLNNSKTPWQFQMNREVTQPYFTCIHLPQTPLSSRLPHNTEQSSVCYIAGTCWLSILNIAMCICPAQTYHSPCPHPHNWSSVSKSVSLFLSYEFICIISF